MCKAAMSSCLPGIFHSGTVAPSVDPFVTTWLRVTTLNFKCPEGEGKSAFGPLLVSGDLQFHWCLGSSRCTQSSRFPTFFFSFGRVGGSGNTQTHISIDHFNSARCGKLFSSFCIALLFFLSFFPFFPPAYPKVLCYPELCYNTQN